MNQDYFIGVTHNLNEYTLANDREEYCSGHEKEEKEDGEDWKSPVAARITLYALML